MHPELTQDWVINTPPLAVNSYGMCMELFFSALGFTFIYTGTHAYMCYIHSYSRVYVFLYILTPMYVVGYEWLGGCGYLARNI